MTFNLDDRFFRPAKNSEGGRVDGNTLFHFSQIGQNFIATYTGPGVSDGHLIGRFLGEDEMTLIYHSRSETDDLEAGEAVAKVEQDSDGRLTLNMKWTWLNGSKTAGTSNYVEVLPNELEDTP